MRKASEKGVVVPPAPKSVGWRQQPCFGDTIERSRPRATGQHVPRANRSSSYLQIHELLVTLKDSIGVRTFPGYIPNEIIHTSITIPLLFLCFCLLVSSWEPRKRVRRDAEYRHHDKIQKTAYLRIDCPKFQEWAAGKDSSLGKVKGETSWVKKGNTRDRGHICRATSRGCIRSLINKTWKGEGFCVREGSKGVLRLSHH